MNEYEPENNQYVDRFVNVSVDDGHATDSIKQTSLLRDVFF